MGVERPRLIVPEGIRIRPEGLGTDSRERGEWRKTNNANAVAQALHDVYQRRSVTGEMSGPELFGALVENVIAAIQAKTPPSQWAEVGDAVCTLLMRRMTQR
ncbi:MAG: hypothetical protein KGL39_57340 [Patescibacteria group bacterium]|nr:hypothetical protein [Patescibacteria group bacterium]